MSASQAAADPFRTGSAVLPYTGGEYLKSLRDGREV